MLSDGARDLRPVACESDGGDSDGQVSPEFSAVQCISFFRFGRVSYYAFHTYHTNIDNILLNIENISRMLPRIAKIYWGKSEHGFGGNRSVIPARVRLRVALGCEAPPP